MVASLMNLSRLPFAQEQEHILLSVGLSGAFTETWKLSIYYVNIIHHVPERHVQLKVYLKILFVVFGTSTTCSRCARPVLAMRGCLSQPQPMTHKITADQCGSEVR